MANEISVAASLSLARLGTTVAAAFSKHADFDGDQSIANVQIIGTAAEAVVLGDVTTVGYVLLKNQDATNFIQIDSVNTMDGFTQKLLAGDFILLKPEAATIYAKADTADCNLFVQAFEL